ncbi:MAG: allantoinase AllB [Myxococcota bacterium]
MSGGVQTLASRHVVTPAGVVDGVVSIADGRIVAVSNRQAFAGEITRDLGELWLLPGLVDGHVHLNEPGRTEWEGFATATRAAAVGGITTLVDMPLNCIPVTTSAAALAEKLAACEGQLFVDCGFWGGVVPGNAADLGRLIDAGALGAKAFLCHSGIDDFPNSTEADLRLAMPALREAGAPLLAHAELELGVDPEALAGFSAADYEHWLRSRPKIYEDAAIALLIALCRETGCPVHIVHLSSATALPLLASARAEGLPVTVETCPHYLCLASEEVPPGDTTWKCAPPIRESDNRDALWQGLRDGVIDQVVSDHSPCTPALKHLDSGDFEAAWGGIASLQLGLRTVWTEARRRGFALTDIARWMAETPARIAGLAPRKGRIAVGLDADLVAFDPDAVGRVDAASLLHRHKVTPYAGAEISGRVVTTWLRGEVVHDDGATVGTPRGQTLLGRMDGGPVSARIARQLDALGAEAEAAIHRCCGSRAFAQALAAGLPYADDGALFAAADAVWSRLGPDDWREAFSHHPEIGSSLESLRERFAATSTWSAGEQSGVSGASEQTLVALATKNRAYRERFGFVFLICATGKSAEEMLAALQARLPNDAATELANAAAEQAKITRIRLEKLCP